MTFKTHLNIRKCVKRLRGFTLIETLLAILILTIAITGPLTIAAKGLQTTLIARDQVMATFLAQDAIEYVRFVRDTDRLNNQNWLAGLNGVSNGHTNLGKAEADCTGDGSNNRYCTVDSITDQATFCGSSVASCASTYLYYDTAAGLYTYRTSGTTKTIFSRTMTITLSPTNPSEADVAVTVQWKDVGGILRSIELRDNLFNWQ